MQFRSRRDADWNEKQPHKRGETKGGDWSCTDYLDVKDSAHGEQVEGQTTLGYNRYKREKGVAQVKEGNAGNLSERFKIAGGAQTLRDNDAGRCMAGRWKGRVVQEENCAAEHTGNLERGPALYTRWTGKQTNRGWPGTSEGKINTAQGMAGDLVSSLNSEEKDTVAHTAGLRT